ncbi:hypothetical protein AVEN_117074-1, partial [Araneus ventricosus]
VKERETIDLDLIDSQPLLKRVHFHHTLRLNLRKSFYKKHLGELVRGHKAGSRRRTNSPGEIVLVESKGPNKINWYLAQRLFLLKISEVPREEKFTPEPRPSHANAPNSKVSQKTEATPELEPRDAFVSERAKVTLYGRREVPVNE